MIKRIKVKFDIIEAIHYFWQVTSEKGKVGEQYLDTLTEFPEISYIFDNDFTKESMRKVLSAISNREVLNSSSKKDRKFWNYNMWMMEDLEFTYMMIKPIKTLNLNSLVDKLNAKNENIKYEELEVVFVPGHENEYLIVDNKLIINFFRVKVDLYEEDKVTIGETPLVDYIEEKLTELISK